MRRDHIIFFIEKARAILSAIKNRLCGRSLLHRQGGERPHNCDPELAVGGQRLAGVPGDILENWDDSVSVGCPVWMITREGAEWAPANCCDDRMQYIHEHPEKCLHTTQSLTPNPETGVPVLGVPMHMRKPPPGELEA